MKPGYRRCISCSKVSPKESFLRIVRVYPSGKVELNSGNGRSAYICPEVNCLRGARQKNRLGRALKTSVPQNIYEQLSCGLTLEDNLKQ